MPGEGKFEKAIFELRPAADVVDDPGCTAAGGRRHYDGDMGKLSSDSAGDEVAWQVVARVFGDGQARAFVFEEGLEIGHPAMVDVLICATQAPVFGIGGEVFLHVLMDELLEIQAERPVSANNFVCADARFGGHIPSRIGQRNVGWLISDGVSGAV